MAGHSKIATPQRVELVLAVLRGQEKLEPLARRHQVSATTLRRWRDQFIVGGRAKLSGRTEVLTAAAEIKRLRRELADRELAVGELAAANRFLQKRAGPLTWDDAARRELQDELAGSGQRLRLTRVLDALGARRAWYQPKESKRPPVASPPGRPGPAPKTPTPWERELVRRVAAARPQAGYKRVTAMCRSLGERISARRVYGIMRAAGLLHQPTPRRKA
jgi:transposase-like protein